MAQAPHTRTSEWPSEGRSALVLSLIAAAVFGLLAGCGAALEVSWLSEHPDFGWGFTALAWIATSPAPALALTFVCLAAFVGVVLRIGAGRSGCWPPESVLTAVLLIPTYALLPVVVLFLGPFAVWLLTWVGSLLYHCPPGEYCPTF
ncbi:hypothetical protein [Lentzea sp. NPDC003310]|uniref:hypothetical protein n=1 Tax=Lentzea sp. NPDC003310 TaxID=3154447 RepID=UPI0033B7E7A4